MAAIRVESANDCEHFEYCQGDMDCALCPAYPHGSCAKVDEYPSSIIAKSMLEGEEYDG